MIISASRRTDIPAFYSEWLMNRIQTGYVKTRNPFNPAQVREVSLCHEDVDCFVFRIKDPPLPCCLSCALWIGKPISAKADPNQRHGCGCCRSVGIGVYNTCGNGCVYCYANHSAAGAERNRQRISGKRIILIH